MLLDLRHPISDALEGAAIAHVVHEQYALRTAEIRRRDRAETLLARCVPYLQLDTLAIELNILDLEVNADRCDERGRERIVGVAQ